MTLSPVRRGEEDDLRRVLSEIACRPDCNPYVDFGKSPSTHFVRFVVTTDEDHGPRLLFVANYDGGLRDYVSELERAGPGLAQVFGRTEGFHDRDLMAYARRHCCKPRGVYVGFPGLTVEGVRNLVGIRDDLETFVDRTDLGTPAGGRALTGFLGRVGALRCRQPALEAAATAIHQAAERVGGSVHEALLEQFLRFAEWFASQGQAPTFPKFHGGCDDPAALLRRRATEQALDSFEVGPAQVQNQMTTVTDVIPERLVRLRFALAATTFLGRFGWPPGEFADVGTLHWFAWALVDNNRRLIFLSTFDGSWQNYMQDFITKLVWGLDALYTNTTGYPAAGMKDVPAFTDFILDHQYPPSVFYSAYPRESVMNLIQDGAIAAGLCRHFDRGAVEQWLARL